MNPASSVPSILRFGVFELDPRAGELRKQGMKIRLQGQPVQILVMLLERPGEIVTREELQKKLWPADTFVDFEQGLNNAIKRLRAALDDSAETPRFIETLPRRGYRFIGLLDPPAAAHSGDKVRSSRINGNSKLVLLSFLIIAIAVILGTAEFRLPKGPKQRFVYVVVVPFDTLSSEPNQQYLGTGMTEVLTADLAKIKSLRVISDETLKGMSDRRSWIEGFGAPGAVKVSAVLRGSVARSGDRIRISARLIEADSGRHLWAETYERDLRDLLLLEGQVAQAIAEAVRVTVSPADAARLKGVARSPAVQEAYLKGVFYANQLNCDGFKRALDEFHYAIDQDSHFAEAYAALAGDYYGLGDWGCVPRKDAWPASRVFAQKAIELDEGTAEVHSTLADIAFIYDWAWDAADREYKRATDLDPAFSSNRALFLFTMHRRAEAFSEIDRELGLNPVDESTNAQLAYMFYLDRQYDKAIEQFQRTIEMYPQSEVAHKWLSISYEQKGNFDAAFKTALKLQEIAGYRPGELSRLRNGYERGGLTRFYEEELAIDEARAKPGEFDECGEPEAYLRFGKSARALDCLEEGYRNHTLPVDRLNSDAQFDPLRSEPRFQALLRRVNFPH